ncbi:MAG: AAA-like domain-containing protein [Eubacteriales bacterium]|nr:AAA-like domain-containing protein [Eubacteriales bacterium]
MKTFNTVGCCIPDRHYMVNIDDKLKKIKNLVDGGYYFAINRARQYGKTTTLGILAERLKDEYVVISLDFQMMSDYDFRDEATFVSSFAEMFLAEATMPDNMLAELRGAEESGMITGLRKLFIYLSNLCEKSDKPVVLMIDEVDSATNNQVFLDFLAQLRAYYLARNTKPTFQSVILAGVYDIKNLKLKLRAEEEHKYNSPWNIAASFDVDMSFSPAAIAGMLQDYEHDYHTGMDVDAVAACIYEYTSGYPFLVSNVCKTIDTMGTEKERLQSGKPVWSKYGVAEAVKRILKEQSTLFDSLNKYLNEYKELRDMLKNMLFQGDSFSYTLYNESINLGIMFGYLKEKDGSVAVANRIFEMWIYNLFLSEDEWKKKGRLNTWHWFRKEDTQLRIFTTCRMENGRS